MSAYHVLITTSGTGSRLGEITQHTNKALVKVGRKPAISYIVELYPEDTQFIVTTGYYGEQVREFLGMAYPNRHFTFIAVDRYEGPGSSLGYSILKAQEHLQQPFIYHACDTIVDTLPPLPTNNWAGGYHGSGSSHYASFDALDGKLQRIMDKGESIQPDYLHIGLIGIADYEAFWSILQELYSQQPAFSALGDVHVINRMLEQGRVFAAQPFSSWHDIGNVESLAATRKAVDDSFQILDKLGESIFLFPDFVIKFFADEDIVRNRATRATILDGLVPKLEAVGRHFYRYQYTHGALFADVANRVSFRAFLDWSTKNLWKETSEVEPTKFTKTVKAFYLDKTLKRVHQFQQSRGVVDQARTINGVSVPPLFEMLNQIDFERLAQTKQTLFHGDFILDNIIQTQTGFCLLDWRQDFGGLLRAGDQYYDLAKLNHNLTVNHEIIHDNLFSVRIHQNTVTCDILRKQRLVECQDELFAFLEREGLDEHKVRLLTALIWLNMSALHHHPFDAFLYYFGSYRLWQALNQFPKQLTMMNTSAKQTPTPVPTGGL